jgi:hypothetical protein
MRDGTYDIFISYSVDTDERIVNNIKKYFEHICMKVFDWPRDSKAIGDRLKETLETAIEECSHVFVLVTKKALQSPWIEFEVDCALRHKKILIPVYSMESTEFPPILSERRGIKYSGWEDVLSDLEEMADDEVRGWGYTAYIPAGGFSGGRIDFCAPVPKALCQIGERPMLFHVIDSLEASPVRKVVVINHKEHAPDYIRYITSLEYSNRKTSNRSARDGTGFSGKVVFEETDKKYWPWALRDLAPKRPFVLQLCDVILSFDENAENKDLKRLRASWTNAFSRHKVHQKKWDDAFLGTLITCGYYRLSVGVIAEMDKEEPDEIKKVEENPMLRLPTYTRDNDTHRINKLLGKFNTGVAILQPKILDFVKEEERDESLLGGAVDRALSEGKGRFVEYPWADWYHVMHLIDWANLHKQRQNIKTVRE